MKSKIILFLVLLISLVLVQSAGAVNFNNPVVKLIPDQTSYTPGETVTITADVLLTSSGDSTFPNSHSLKAYTGLENPEWVYSIKINGHGEDLESSKNPLVIGGWELDYPSSGNEIVVSFSLTGTVPSVPNTGEKIFFQLIQTDGSGNEVTSGAPNPIERMVINPSDITKLSQVVETELSNFNDQIQSKIAAGVDVSAAQKKYDDAEEKIVDSATASYGDANELLNEARVLIDEGEVLLNQAWAQKAIDSAQETLDSIDFYIVDFKVNRSMTNDARVINIETKVESAQSSLNSAKSLFNDANYPQAYTLAETSKTKAEEALTYAEEVYAEVSKGLIPDLGSFTFIIIGVIIVIVAVVGYVIYSRSAWDELG
ncbi:MAG: hypothetical protein JW931_04025 [Methanomicrobiaceae archaeon]|nr:hypothetical protein [Methanomicrobiaceae archaeon]